MLKGMKEKKFMKWLLTGILTAVMVPVLVLTQKGDSYAAEGDVVLSGTAGDCKYQVVEEGGTKNAPYVIKISGNGKMENYKENSSEYGRSTAPWKEYLSSIWKIEIQNGVTTVGAYAFVPGGTRSANVTDIIIADSVKYINRGAFSDQRSVKNLKIGSGVEEIGDYAFTSMPLNELKLPDKLRIIGTKTFANNFNIRQLAFSDKVYSIYDSAFYLCTALNSVSFGSDMKTIKKNTFQKCDSLKGIVLPSNITTIEEGAFSGATSLTDIYYGGTSAEWAALSVQSGNDSFKKATVHYGLNDALKISTDVPVSGTLLQVSFKDSLFYLRDWTGFDMHWQRSSNGTSGWTDIDAEVDPNYGPRYYRVQDEDVNCYLRVRISKKGFRTESYSPVVKVLDGISISTRFTDPKFRDYISENCDKDHNGVLTQKEIDNIYELYIGNMEIASLKGVEYLDQLRKLYAAHNKIKYADLTGARNLMVLDLSENDELTTVIVTENEYLEELYLEDTAMKNINLSGNPELRKLGLYRAKFNKVDIRNNPYLVDAAIYGTEKDHGFFKSYTFGKNDLMISGENLLVATIDEFTFVSDGMRKELKKVNYDWDQDGILSMQEALNVKSLSLGDYEDEVWSLWGDTFFPNLTYLSAFNCRISYPNLSNNKQLTYVDLSANNLYEIDVTTLSKLETLDIYNNPKLEALDVSKNPELSSLCCDGTAIKTLDISKNSKLKSAYAGKKTEKTNTDLGRKYYIYTSNENASWQLVVDTDTQITGASTAAVTGTWKHNSTGWWYQYSDGTYPKNQWLQIDGQWYFFKASGYMASNEYCGGYWLNKNGSWTYKAKASWKHDSKGWWYQDTKGWYPKNQWLKIDDQWYFFKANGYMASNEYCDGYWLNKNGTWTYKARASWQKDSKGWKYVDTKGWYAKNQTLTIDGKSYSFDAQGYMK